MLDKKKEHLPIYGPGPAFGGSVILMTLTAFFMRKAPFLSAGLVDGIGQKLFIVAGILCVLFGIGLWVYAVPISKIDDGIMNNHLITTGAYAFVRNPIYSSIMIACNGIVLISCNLFFLILPFGYWILLTLLLKNTEEKWLRDLYGMEYEAYMPYLCNLDYVNFGLLGAPLFREHTCFEDGDYCDFKLKIDASPLPYCPPVFLQDNPYK